MKAKVIFGSILESCLSLSKSAKTNREKKMIGLKI
ncbi:unnamed protein product [Brugia timori]|uniref:Lipoprotein n=1 Tax=Brugia timori TaxID=42155 RepID=A0A0R3QY86_9BILA|nr:unnamed protein product [Brugia timori]